MSSCKCFNQEVTGRSLIERLPASTCQCTSKARLMVEENGRKFVLIVSDWKNVEKIKVDGALICYQEKEKSFIILREKRKMIVMLILWS